MSDVSTYRIEGVATLLSSLSHGGEHAGTISYLRRERIVGADGQPTMVPIVSGNSLRGVLRDHAAEIFWAALGRPTLPAPVFHLLWSGGALAKAGAGHTLGARQLAEVRRLVPVVSLFGGSGAGKIIEGKLLVGKLVPICAETAHLVPDGLGDEPLPSVWEMLQIEEFTRRDDLKREGLHAAVAELARRDELSDGTGVLAKVDDHEPAPEAGVLDGPPQQMRYGVETLAAGTRLHWWMALREVTSVEVALIAAAIDSWVANGAHLGGRSATGHGRLRLDVHQWAHQTPVVTVGEALDVSKDRLVEHVSEHHDEILEVLSWFAD